MRLLFFLIMSFQLNAQLLYRKEEHKINMDLLQYHYNKEKQRMLVVKPFKRVKLTFKAGLNSSTILPKMNVDTLKKGDFKDAFSDVDNDDYVGIIKYDARAKFYITKKLRIITRMQFLGIDQVLYTAGLSIKI